MGKASRQVWVSNFIIVLSVTHKCIVEDTIHAQNCWNSVSPSPRRRQYSLLAEYTVRHSTFGPQIGAI